MYAFVCAIFYCCHDLIPCLFFFIILLLGHTLHSRLYLNKLFSQAAPQNKVTSSTLGIKLLDKLHFDKLWCLIKPVTI